MKNKMYIAIASVALIGLATVVTVSSVFAQETGDTTTFVQKLAQKLGISEDKVKTAVDELHTERHVQMQAAYEKELQTYVDNGEITAAQKDLIVAKMKELQTNRQSKMESMQSMTREERRAAMEAERTALETWANENNIDMKYLRVMKPFGGKGGRGGDHFLKFDAHRGSMPSASSTAMQ